MTLLKAKAVKMAKPVSGKVGKPVSGKKAASVPLVGTPLPVPGSAADTLMTPRYMRRGQVMRLLGITEYEFRKWLDSGLLKPRRRPDPHRLGAKNGQKALFDVNEVAAIRLNT